MFEARSLTLLNLRATALLKTEIKQKRAVSYVTPHDYLFQMKGCGFPVGALDWVECSNRK